MAIMNVSVNNQFIVQSHEALFVLSGSVEIGSSSAIV